MAALGQGVEVTTPIVHGVGPYRLEGVLGEGGMGVVHRGIHRITGDEVAIKLLRRADAGLVASFRREVFALRNVDHPGVVRIVDDGVEDGLPWYAMELLRGGTLRDLLDDQHDRSGAGNWTTASWTDTTETPRPSDFPSGLHERPTMPPVAPDLRIRPLLDALRGLCQTLAYLHGAGIVHRDLKPSNIFLREEGPVLVDFGLARSVALRTGREILDDTPGPRGTPAYMAPEQIRGEMVDARTDLYAVGCILYECLVGEPPFEGGTVSVLRRHLTEAPPPIDHPDVAQDLAELVARLLAKRPRERIGHALDVAHVLARHGAEGLASPLPPPRPYLHRPALAGRRAELEAICEASLQRSHEGGTIAVIGGHSGMGKTRLAAEVARRAGGLGMRVVTGRAEAASTAPLQPFRELLRMVADLTRAHPSFGEEILGSDGPLLAAYEPTLARLPHLTATPLAADVYPLLAAMTRVLSRLAVRQALVLIIDDLQWADPLSISLLLHLAQAPLARVPILIVGTYRAEERVAWLDELLAADATFSLDLMPLREAAIGTMVSDMLALDDVPPRLLQPLVQSSEGNPFFIVEYLRLALERDLLVRRDDGHWEPRLAQTWEGVPVPASLVELVERRYEPLLEEAKRLVDAASVLGRVFTAEVAVEAAGLDELSGRRALEELRERGWVEEALRGQLRFAHDKLRELSFERLTAAARPPLHLRAAEALERHVAGTDAADLASGELARHFEAAGELARALPYRARAGAHALALAASEAARDHYERAFAISEELGLESPARWHQDLGDAYYNLGLLRAADVHLRQALIGTARELKLRWPNVIGGRFRRSLEAADVERARAITLTLERLSQVHFFLHQQGTSFAAAVAAAQASTLLGPSPERARSLATMGVALGVVPGLRRVSRHLERAATIARGLDDPFAPAVVRYFTGLAKLNAGELPEARRALRGAYEDLRAQERVRMAHEALALFGSSCTLAGEGAEAARCFTELQSWAEQVGDAQARVWALSGQATAKLRAGDLDGALETFEACAAATVDLDDMAQRIANGGRALALLELGRIDAATEVAREVTEMAAASRPAAFHAFFGTGAACEVMIHRWEVEGTRWREPALRAIAQHRRLARSFPVATPTATAFRGQAALLDGAVDRGLGLLEVAARQAAAKGMPLERNLAHLTLASHRLGGTARAAALDALDHAFSRRGAELYRRRVARLR